MKVSYKWLKSLADLEGITYDELVRDLSLHIVEVDAIDKLAKGTNLIVAKVLEKVMHPNSDHLSICQVDTGNGVLQVVCGAPNVAASQKVILALPGAVLEGVRTATVSFSWITKSPVGINTSLPRIIAQTRAFVFIFAKESFMALLVKKQLL